MNYKELDIKRSYISMGNDNIAKAFLNPALACTKTYKRSVGFFSSSVLVPILNGIVSLARNNGSVQLIASPNLSADDVDAIGKGYELREKVISNAFTKDFLRELESLDDSKLELLANLIARGILDIKIAVTDTAGIYHDKLGVLEDFDGNKIAFYGSANSTISGYQNNYEKIRIARSWDDGEHGSVIDEEMEFDALWSGTHDFVKVYSYTESAKENILKVMTERAENAGKAPIKLRDYQEQAIEAWVNNGYHGFYVMATGTGKTWTAIFSAKELLEDHAGMVVICAPYKHLVKQWCEDVEKAFPDAIIILVSSENAKWESQMTEAIINKRYNPGTQIIIISTIASFNMKRFQTTLSKSAEDKLLIVDEAHRFTERSEKLKEQFVYMLGLSATPFSGTSAAKGRELMNFFGGQVFSLPIESALDRGYLVPYYYHPIYVNSTEEDEERFNFFSRKIAACFRNGVCIDADQLVKALRGRLRTISMAEEKQEKIVSIIDAINEKDHFVVYCGDGKLFDYNTGEELRHIQSIKRVLSGAGYKASQFTASENMDERMQLVDAFNKGEISALAAIRCLDEGINIPSIKSALILSSNDDYREFVQRRGRILRQYKGKEFAHIYDVVVLPSSDMQSWAKIEFRRFHEYAKLALNYEDLKSEFDRYLIEYSLELADVDVYDYEDMEDGLDE